MALLIDIASWVFLTAGGLFLLIGGIGLLRLPDFYTRMHAAGIIDTMGAGLIMVGLMFQGGLTQTTVKLILTILFIYFTSPIATHMLAKAAKHGKHEPLLGEQGRSKKSLT